MKSLKVVALAGVMAMSVPVFASEIESVTVYEYKVVDINRLAAPEVFQDTLNELGRSGWKLVSNERLTYNGMHTVVRFFMMREVKPDE